jgi:hypothetical protein
LRSTLYRPVGIAAVTVICAQFVLGGKPYYPGAIYTFLFAAGATALTARPARIQAAVYCIAAVISSAIALPLLPAAALHRFPVQKVNYDLGEEIGIDPALLHREFAHVTQAAVYHNGLGADDDEEGTPVYVVTGLRTSWATAWPAFQDFS